jgi:hypothetical protein
MVIGYGFRQTVEFWISDCFIDNLINSAASTTGGNFDEFVDQMPQDVL